MVYVASYPTSTPPLSCSAVSLSLTPFDQHSVFQNGGVMHLSVVIPVFNEADNIPMLLTRLRDSLATFSWELIFVDDGSTDDTSLIIRDAALLDQHIRLLKFSRNFGHQAAVTAGLDFAEGDAVIVMDGDLQDPPELIPEMVALFKHGYDVVSPRRSSRRGESLLKRGTAAAFYRCMSYLMGQRLTLDVGDFRLFSKRALLAIRSLREQHRFLRGMSSWLGLSEVVIPFDRPARAGGISKYSPLKVLRFAWTAITSFSALPLRLSMTAGSILSGLGFLYLLKVVYLAMFTNTLVPGWASVVGLQCAFSGMILLALGVAGDYIARTYEESKLRPLYVVADGYNIAYPRHIPQRSIILSALEPGLGQTLTPSHARFAPTGQDSFPQFGTLQ
jgi:polyisoprenyl-phosphate glycosyltransferase